MDPEKIVKIKNAVRTNYNESPGLYDDFEDRYGFFRTLTVTLLARMRLPNGADVLDVGCGTGASTARIAEVVRGSRVCGLDNSSAMLGVARTRVGESDRVSFLEGDAARLRDYFDSHFDGILYNASIFLIPDYEESLRQARDLLKAGGRVGLTFMDGVYDQSNKNALAEADREAGEGVSLKKAVKLPELIAFFKELFPFHESSSEDFRLPLELLRDFFSVQAMSAGLFPHFEYSERVRKVARLFDHLPMTTVFFRWIIMVGRLK
jgi:ubiquinone/menaquinone biosynthesis C-methylase UbiE